MLSQLFGVLLSFGPRRVRKVDTFQTRWKGGENQSAPISFSSSAQFPRSLLDVSERSSSLTEMTSKKYKRYKESWNNSCNSIIEAAKRTDSFDYSTWMDYKAQVKNQCAELCEKIRPPLRGRDGLNGLIGGEGVRHQLLKDLKEIKKKTYETLFCIFLESSTFSSRSSDSVRSLKPLADSTASPSTSISSISGDSDERDSVEKSGVSEGNWRWAVTPIGGRELQQLREEMERASERMDRMEKRAQEIVEEVSENENGKFAFAERFEREMQREMQRCFQELTQMREEFREERDKDLRKKEEKRTAKEQRCP